MRVHGAVGKTRRWTDNRGRFRGATVPGIRLTISRCGFRFDNTGTRQGLPYTDREGSDRDGGVGDANIAASGGVSAMSDRSDGCDRAIRIEDVRLGYVESVREVEIEGTQSGIGRLSGSALG